MIKLFYVYFAPVEVQSIAISVSVCLSVCLLAYFKHHMSKFHQILCTCYLCCGSVLLWWQRNKLCTSSNVHKCYIFT